MLEDAYMRVSQTLRAWSRCSCVAGSGRGTALSPRHVQLLDPCDLPSGGWQYRVPAALCTQGRFCCSVLVFFFFFPCEVEVASSKGTFNSVRIEGTPLLPGLIFPQGLFSEDCVFQVLTDPISAFLCICWLVHYDLACNLCNSSKASWI